MPAPDSRPWLEPVPQLWARVVGAVLLLAAAGLTVLLLRQSYAWYASDDARRSLTSATLIFALIEIALGGICWQAGYRLAFGRPRSLFSRPAWFAIGAVLLVVGVLMAWEVVAARRPNAMDLLVIASFGAFGVWCLILALRPPGAQQDDP